MATKSIIFTFFQNVCPNYCCNTQSRKKREKFHPCDEQHCSVDLCGIADPSLLSVKCWEHVKRLDLCCIISSLFHSWGWLAGVELAGFFAFLANEHSTGTSVPLICLCQKYESKEEAFVYSFLCRFFHRWITHCLVFLDRKYP